MPGKDEHQKQYHWEKTQRINILLNETFEIEKSLNKL